SINVDKQPLSEAIKFLQDYTGLNMVLDPKGLSDEGITFAAPVTLSVNNVSIKTALKLMLRPLGLTYKVEDEVVLITSPQATQAETITQTYYVGDLMIPPNSEARNLLPHNVMNHESGAEMNPLGNLTTSPVVPGGQAGGPGGAQTGNGIGTVKGDRPV